MIAPTSMADSPFSSWRRFCLETQLKPEMNFYCSPSRGQEGESESRDETTLHGRGVAEGSQSTTHTPLTGHLSEDRSLSLTDFGNNSESEISERWATTLQCTPHPCSMCSHQQLDLDIATSSGFPNESSQRDTKIGSSIDNGKAQEEPLSSAETA